MTTTYTPDGTIAPTEEYVLPQDVIDLVVVETVNNPFVTGADNIAWLLVMFAATCSVKNFGAVGDGVANDTAAIAAAFAARKFVFFPEGTYRTTAPVAVRAGTLAFGVRGKSIVLLDHATNHFFTFADDDTFAQFRDLKIEGLQANSGNVFRSTGARVSIDLQFCLVNQNLLLQGRLVNVDYWNVSGGALVSRYTGSAYSLSGDRFTIDNCAVEMAPAAIFPLIGNQGSGSRATLTNNYFSRASTVGGSFIDLSIGSTVAEGNTFDVTEVSGGLTYAYKVNGGLAQVSGNVFKNDAYDMQFSLRLAKGSRFEMRPCETRVGTGATITCDNGLESEVIEATNAAPPSIALPRIVFEGQRFTALITNGSIGNWSGAFVLTAQVGDGILDAGAAEFTDLLAGRVCAVTFVAADHFGDVIWQQAGASAQVPP